MSARVLIVDDIHANRRLLQAKLETRYFEVLMASNGVEALEQAESEQPDIILLDVMMPGMDGYEVCARLKSNRKTSHIPVVMLTALNEHEERIKGLRAGAEDFITKPFDDFALFSRMQALARYSSVARELRLRGQGVHRGDILLDGDYENLKRPAQIVIVDTNAREVRRLKEKLQAFGHRAVGFDEQAGADLLEGGVDIIIMSVVRQPYDPLRLCARFKMNESLRGVSIIMVVDAASRATGLRALDLGASDIIMSPLDREELQARVSTQLKRSRYIDILRRRVDRGMELAVIDPLTGLYNRRYMISYLSQTLNRARQGGEAFSVIMLDIDYFKKINDTYGHEAGDAVLSEFAKRLTEQTRPGDVVCRYGGEEFLILMPRTDPALAYSIAERVRAEIAARPFEVEGVPVSLPITVSAGVSTWRQAAADHKGGDHGSADELIKRADDALYTAKSAGRNRVESLAA